MSSTVLFLGGNGHAPVRLEAVRSVLEQGNPFSLVEIPYPGATSFNGMLDELTVTIEAPRPDSPTMLYASGIGGLVALALRARGSLLDLPIVMQGPVLWGLEHRRFPRILRLPGMPRLLTAAFRLRALRRRFVAKHLQVQPDADWLARFFDGYDDADAFARWFAWLTPDLLRGLESRLAEAPTALSRITAWWGDRDTVVTTEELRITEKALGTTIPLTRFAEWGHYPMIDDPEGWVEEVRRVAASG